MTATAEDYRAATRRRLRRWRAETGRTRTARVDLAALGRALAAADPEHRRLLTEALGDDVTALAEAAYQASAGHDRPDLSPPGP